MTKIIRARHVETVCNTKPKGWSQTLGSCSGFLTLSLQSRYLVLDPESWVPVYGSHIMYVPGSNPWVPVQSLNIPKRDKKLLLSVTYKI